MATKTKIVATLGPASDNETVIRQLIQNGVDVFRLNFSHGTLDGHAKVLETINKVRAEFIHAVAVMGDLCGPSMP
ncbi:MAG: pyruvate kinase [Planctomycetota bacterium]|jgi:pyruvate kinase